MFKKGEQVVCVDASIKVPMELHNKYFEQWVDQDEVYTIRRSSMNLDGGWSVVLEEVVNTPKYNKELMGKHEPMIMSERFRRLEEFADDMELSEEITEEFEKELVEVE